MRHIVLFIAMSLDGYIADADGGVGWLNGQGDEAENEDTYSEFVKNIDTVVMGWTTYHQVSTELSPLEWVYRDLKTYIITHHEQISRENIEFVHEAPSELIRWLKKEQGKDVWICGGASIVRQLMQDGLIDRFHISIIPTLLGSGIRLFEAFDKEIKLSLLKSRTYNGITEVAERFKCLLK